MAPSPTAQKISFRKATSFMGCVDYEVYGDGPKYTVEVRKEAGDYELSIFNGTENEWQRDVVAAINVIRKKYSSDPIDQCVVDAFNAWRRTDHEADLADILSKPEKYGELSESDPLRIPPPVVRGGHYETGTGLIIQEPGGPASPASESISRSFAAEFEEVGPRL